MHVSAEQCNVEYISHLEDFALLMHTITLCKKHDLKINAILDHLHICVFQHDMRCLRWYPEKDTRVYVLISQVFINDNK